ncbi:MAG: ATP-grasp domain-containing protein, partial [Syntrophorhabdaceae bacterium]|nr:ATP-grasp domain-containing protein [Syntrophorhabdaceae bacterium]
GRCREAHIPAVLEMLGIPYVGSDPLTLSVTLDKPITKKLVEREGFPTPPFRTYRRAEEFTEWPFSFPVIVKPVFEGSSKGVRLSSRACDFVQARKMVSFVTNVYRQDALVEAFVPGAEVTVGILGNDPPGIVGIMEIVPKLVHPSKFVYSLEVKRDWENQVFYRVPPALPKPVLARVEHCALGIYKALGCRDFSRIDFRIDLDETPQFIECNPLPGLSPGYGDLPIMAQRAGMSYISLIEEILSHALLRTGISGA